MTITDFNTMSKHPLSEYIHRLESGEALLLDYPENLVEVSAF